MTRACTHGLNSWLWLCVLATRCMYWSRVISIYLHINHIWLLEGRAGLGKCFTPSARQTECSCQLEVTGVLIQFTSLLLVNSRKYNNPHALLHVEMLCIHCVSLCVFFSFLVVDVHKGILTIVDDEAMKTITRMLSSTLEQKRNSWWLKLAYRNLHQ